MIELEENDLRKKLRRKFYGAISDVFMKKGEDITLREVLDEVFEVIEEIPFLDLKTTEQ